MLKNIEINQEINKKDYIISLCKMCGLMTNDKRTNVFSTNLFDELYMEVGNLLSRGDIKTLKQIKSAYKSFVKELTKKSKKRGTKELERAIRVFKGYPDWYNELLCYSYNVDSASNALKITLTLASEENRFVPELIDYIKEDTDGKNYVGMRMMFNEEQARWRFLRYVFTAADIHLFEGFLYDKKALKLSLQQLFTVDALNPVLFEAMENESISSRGKSFSGEGYLNPLFEKGGLTFEEIYKVFGDHIVENIKEDDMDVFFDELAVMKQTGEASFNEITDWIYGDSFFNRLREKFDSNLITQYQMELDLGGRR